MPPRRPHGRATGTSPRSRSRPHPRALPSLSQSHLFRKHSWEAEEPTPGYAAVLTRVKRVARSTRHVAYQPEGMASPHRCEGGRPTHDDGSTPGGTTPPCPRRHPLDILLISWYFSSIPALSPGAASTLTTAYRGKHGRLARVQPRP